MRSAFLNVRRLGEGVHAIRRPISIPLITLDAQKSDLRFTLVQIPLTHSLTHSLTKQIIFTSRNLTKNPNHFTSQPLEETRTRILSSKQNISL